MNLLARLLLVAAVLTLAACATTSSGGRAGADPEEALLDRAIARWEALIAGNVDKAWEYLSPGYRSTHSKDDYTKEMSQRPIRWNKVTPFEPIEGRDDVDAVECDEAMTACDVRLNVRFKIRSHLTSVGEIETATVIKESWIKSKGQWYVVPSNVVQ